MTFRNKRSDSNSILTYIVAPDDYKQEGLVCIRPYFFTYGIGKEKGSQGNEKGEIRVFKGTKRER